MFVAGTEAMVEDLLIEFVESGKGIDVEDLMFAPFLELLLIVDGSADGADDDVDKLKIKVLKMTYLKKKFLLHLVVDSL